MHANLLIERAINLTVAEIICHFEQCWVAFVFLVMISSCLFYFAQLSDLVIVIKAEFESPFYTM